MWASSEEKVVQAKECADNGKSCLSVYIGFLYLSMEITVALMMSDITRVDAEPYGYGSFLCT